MPGAFRRCCTISWYTCTELCSSKLYSTRKGCTNGTVPTVPTVYCKSVAETVVPLPASLIHSLLSAGCATFHYVRYKRDLSFFLETTDYASCNCFFPAKTSLVQQFRPHHTRAQRPISCPKRSCVSRYSPSCYSNKIFTVLRNTIN